MPSSKLTPSYYRSTQVVALARDLLGKYLYSNINHQLTGGIITETEAYAGVTDKASHAYNGRFTARTKTMYQEGGISYVYFTYGMHYCFNVVAKKDGEESGAVLIRSVQPRLGIGTMIKNRKIDLISNLVNGPAKLTQAMQITKKQYHVDLTKDSNLFIIDGIKTTKILAKPRIGIKAGSDKLWNFSFKI